MTNSRTISIQEQTGHSTTPDALYLSFPVIQEMPNRSVSLMTKEGLLMTKQSRHQQNLLFKSSELKFKIESVGIHPVEDDDLDMCPSRTRPSWPNQINPWWVATGPNDKPPYSYATLIAYAILSSKDGRLTLNDIYVWISSRYPTFCIGIGGWQNSIRHNLSLNKKWFYKIDRRPTQTNPGKGCYWTLISGTEHIFIDNLTHESSHSRKHHDIGFTAEISIGQRRGSCHYNNAPLSPQVVALANKNSATSNSTDMTRPLSSHLYTTFRMVKRANKSKQCQSENIEVLDDSDNDSGVDVSNKSIDKKHPRKRRCTTKSKACLPSTSPTQTLQQLKSSMIYDAPKLTSDLNPSFEINNWVEESLLCSENQMYDNNSSNQLEWPSIAHKFAKVDNLWCDSNVVVPQTSNDKKRCPITIDLEDEEFTHKYLHFENQEYLSYDFTATRELYYNLYPKTFIPSVPINIDTLPLSYSPTTFLNNYQLQQFVSMQDILYF